MSLDLTDDKSTLVQAMAWCCQGSVFPDLCLYMASLDRNELMTGNWVYYSADSRFAPSQWETALLCNDVSHWLNASLESALFHCSTYVVQTDSCHWIPISHFRYCDLCYSFIQIRLHHLYMLTLVKETKNIMDLFAFCIISQHWEVVGSRDPLPLQMMHLCIIVNTMAADDLAVQGAMASAAMVLPQFSWNIPMSASKEFISSSLQSNRDKCCDCPMRLITGAPHYHAVLQCYIMHLWSIYNVCLQPYMFTLCICLGAELLFWSFVG